MSSPDFYLCDVCGDRTKHRFNPSTQRVTDEAGSMDDLGVQIDLCGKHMEALLHRLLMDPEYHNRPDYVNGRRFVQSFDKVKRDP